MRGTKRKRDIFTLSESIDNWFVASESVEYPPESEEGAIARCGVNTIIQGHANAVAATTSRRGPIGGWV